MRKPKRPTAISPEPAERKMEGVETRPFDVAAAGAVAGLAEAARAEGAELEALRARMVRLARQVP